MTIDMHLAAHEHARVLLGNCIISGANGLSLRRAGATPRTVASKLLVIVPALALGHQALGATLRFCDRASSTQRLRFEHATCSTSEGTGSIDGLGISGCRSFSQRSPCGVVIGKAG